MTSSTPRESSASPGRGDLETLLRSALPPIADATPRRDLWPAIAGRLDERPRWSWLDLALAAATVVVLTLFPEWTLVLAYHL